MSRSKRFESWFSRWAGLDLEIVESMWNGEYYRSYKYNVEPAWAAWCAAERGYQPNDLDV